MGSKRPPAPLPGWSRCSDGKGVTTVSGVTSTGITGLAIETVVTPLVAGGSECLNQSGREGPGSRAKGLTLVAKYYSGS